MVTTEPEELLYIGMAIAQTETEFKSCKGLVGECPIHSSSGLIGFLQDSLRYFSAKYPGNLI